MAGFAYLLRISGDRIDILFDAVSVVSLKLRIPVYITELALVPRASPRHLDQKAPRLTRRPDRSDMIGPFLIHRFLPHSDSAAIPHTQHKEH